GGVLNPAMLWPQARTVSGSPSWRASRTAAATSTEVRGRTTRSGLPSPANVLVASVYAGSPGSSTPPGIVVVRSCVLRMVEPFVRSPFRTATRQLLLSTAVVVRPATPSGDLVAGSGWPAYAGGRSADVLRKEDAVAGGSLYRRRMRTDRGWRRFYATGWFLSAVIAACGFNAWQQRMQAIEGQLAEEERTREAIIQRVAAEERLRIARDLHDSLTHNISVIKVQSGVAAHLARKRGEEVPPALQAIQEAAGEAARELREVLHVLRQDMDPGNGSRRLADLPQLLDRARAAGLDAEL